MNVMRPLLALIVVLAAPAQALAPTGTPVLMYHKIDSVTPADAVGRSLTIVPAAFEAQLAWLRAHGIRTITVSDLVESLERGETPRDAVVLTFDDGYADAATVATPLLRKYGDHATFYISAGFIGDGRHVSWQQLREMRAAGMEIGCHGTFHRDLTKLGKSEATFEIDHCVQALQRYLGPPTTYAYAAGKWDASIEQIVHNAHLDAAFTEGPGVVVSLRNRYHLPRRRVDRAYNLTSFAALVTP